MSLAEFQRAFADLVASPERCVMLREAVNNELSSYDITLRERQRLEAMVRHEAMSVNCSLYRVNRLIPIYSVLPHTCRLLADRLMVELEAFWAASRHATLQYRWEAQRFGSFLHERIGAGLLPSGPFEDAARLEIAIFDAQIATHPDSMVADGAVDKVPNGRQRIVWLRYAPETLLDPAILTSALEPLADEVAVLVDATGTDLAIRRVMP